MKVRRQESDIFKKKKQKKPERKQRHLPRNLYLTKSERKVNIFGGKALKEAIAISLSLTL